jgi:site-specific DNA recombinase
VEIVIKTIEKNSSKKKMLRVCAYVRVSTDNSEQLDSFETQEAHYKSLIKRNPAWEFVGIYSDEGISGTKTDGRFGLQEMMADSRAGKIDLILTKSLSRFARNTVDALSVYVSALKKKTLTLLQWKANLSCPSWQVLLKRRADLHRKT